MAAVGSPFFAAEGAVRCVVRLTPKAARNAVCGPCSQADGSVALKATVSAAPEDGKANAALIAMLAKAWRVPKGALNIVSGVASRRKVVAVATDEPPAQLLSRLNHWMDCLP